MRKRLVERLERQHKLICAAVHAGRIEELKRMGAPVAQAPVIATLTRRFRRTEEPSQTIAPESTPAPEKARGRAIRAFRN